MCSTRLMRRFPARDRRWRCCSPDDASRGAVPFHEACGKCSYCRAGRSNLCDALEFLGMTHDGGYAQYVNVLNADLNCVPLPDAVSFDAANTTTSLSREML